MRSLWKSFSADQVDHADLQHIIQPHFRSGSQPGEREVVYPGEEPHAIKLRFAKDDRLTDITAGPALTSDCEAAIVGAINDALTSDGPRVFRHVLFAGHKLTGSWRYKDNFQVTPVPSDAPQIECLIGDHPFILESKVTSVKDGFVKSRRASQVLREHELLLAGLVNTSIHELPAKSLYGYWVQLPNEGYETAYLMPGYRYDAPQGLEDFIPVASSAPVLSAAEIFGPYSMSAGTPFSIPNDLADTLDTYYTLPPRTQTQFVRSCYRLQYANQALFQSNSAAFVAVITAAEVLFPQAPAEKCSACGQSRYRLRSAFARLLESSLAALTRRHIGVNRSVQTRLKHLYDSRSKITHGIELRGWDSIFGFTPRGCQDDDDLRTLLHVMPFTLAEWINEQVGRL